MRAELLFVLPDVSDRISTSVYTFAHSFALAFLLINLNEHFMFIQIELSLFFQTTACVDMCSFIHNSPGFVHNCKHVHGINTPSRLPGNRTAVSKDMAPGNRECRIVL